MKKKPHSRLRELRLSQNLKQNELAAAIEVLPGALSRIERGHVRCGELMARRLGQYFMCDWRYFLT